MTDVRDPDDPSLDETDLVIRPPGQQGSDRSGMADGATPERIGGYTIRRVVAHGGMGTVYEALQREPRRVVALKVMKAGIASPEALRRFKYESQVLGRLRHPGIAQVYEAGTHDHGGDELPFFAMEYIPNALTITDYAREKKLGIRQRLDLAAQMCEAVHHGHQKGVIHRDLKPENILVDSQGQVKIIDFGVARTTDADLAVTTLQTDVGQLIGTLSYMSPEQCAADPHDIDTRSDVYALGVVLFELLSGQMPYEFGRRVIHEATRVICDEPPKRLSSINRGWAATWRPSCSSRWKRSGTARTSAAISPAKRSWADRRASCINCVCSPAGTAVCSPH